MSDNSVIFKIESTDNPDVLHVEMSSASVIAFDFNIGEIKRQNKPALPRADYVAVIRDICRVAPNMMSLDADLAEAYDDAFRTQPKELDRTAVKVFLSRYRERVPEELPDQFDMHWSDRDE